jgi:hypothetical protein
MGNRCKRLSKTSSIEVSLNFVKTPSVMIWRMRKLFLGQKNKLGLFSSNYLSKRR